ncbi:hypothetical protein FB472_1173 [Rhodoglobus vestalii]|uniref:Uncharacterized protein n=1 Tax=Rhodoglobus vestalii TaxID=193384 RepID=A0A8H2PTR5_9MICO|nr:hypothetical protein FB472_1163 [Rhodoglobus vestalii]TQO19606.1 hypothetical protein FB472_1173 [Rhodoglobus vestalii]
MRSLLAIFMMVLMSLGLAGCAGFGTVCTAEGYLGVARLSLSDPRTDMSLELCDGQDCEPGAPPQRGGVEPAETSPAPVTVDTGVLSLSGDSVDGWRADFVGGQPVVGYRLRDTSGEIVSEGSVNVDWVRVGGTAQCGGPREAVIELPG